MDVPTQGETAAAADPGRPEVIPDWLANLAALGWRVIAVATLVVVLSLIASLLWTVTASIAVGAVIAAVLAPSVLRLRASGRTDSAAAAIVWVAAMACAVAVLLVLLLFFAPYLADMAARIGAGLTELEAQVAALDVPAPVNALIAGLAARAQGSIVDALGSAASSVAGIVTVLVLSSFLVFFFLRDGDKAWLWAFQAVSDPKRDRITDAGRHALIRVGGYLRGTTILSASIAVTDLVFMLVLGVPLAVPLAILVFLGGYIPYFGGIVTSTIILLVTLAALGPFSVLVLLVLIGIRNVILGYGVRPAVYGRTVSLHPALVLIILPAGYQLAGVIGLFVAVPVMAVVFAIAKAVVAILDPDPRPELPGLVPAWLDRLAQWSWRLLVGLGLVALAVEVFVTIPTVLIPILLGTILAATFEPVVRALIRRGRSRAAASAIAVGGGFVGVAGVLLLTVLVLVDQASTLGNRAVEGAGSVDSASGGRLEFLVQFAALGGNEVVRNAIALAGEIAGVAVIVVLSTLLAFYFLRDGGRLWRLVVARSRPGVAANVEAAGTRAFEVLGGYMFGTAAISLVGATSQLVIMLLLGLPLALPVFVLSFFLCFIPYIGGFISTGVALLIAIAAGSTADIAIMVVWTLVFNIVTGNVVSPIVYGKTVHLHPAVVLLAIPAGSAIAGVLGMFIVVPVLGVVAATWRTVLAVMAARSTPGPVVGLETPEPVVGLTTPVPPDEAAAPAPG